MPTGKFWLLFVVVCGLSVAALWTARSSFIRARLIEDMPTSRIRSASQGYVELIGLADARGNQLVSPLAGLPCLWWRYRVERYQQSRKSSSWVTVDKGVSTAPFFMADGSGFCRVEPDGAEVSCLHRRRWYGRTPKPEGSSTAEKSGLLARLGHLSQGRRYRYTEHLIRDGDPLYLLGHFVTDSKGRRTLAIDQAVGQLIRQWKKDFRQLLVRFDSDGNGLLDEAEWQRVRASAEKSALRSPRPEPDDHAPHALIKPEEGDRPFLIGSHGQESLSSRYRWRALGGAGFFLAAGALATWMISSRLGG